MALLSGKIFPSLTAPNYIDTRLRKHSHFLPCDWLISAGEPSGGITKRFNGVVQQRLNILPDDVITTEEFAYVLLLY